METLLALGIGIGLSSVAGVRAFVPLALAALFTGPGLFELPAPFDVLSDGLVIAALLALAFVESGLDKIPALDRVFNYTMVPVRSFAGAVLFAAALDLGAGSLPWLAAGGAIAGVVAVVKVLVRPPARAASAGVSASFLSGCEDVVAVVGGAVGFFVPYLPLLPVAFLLFFFRRIRKRRGRKYGGLRILGD